VRCWEGRLICNDVTGIADKACAAIFIAIIDAYLYRSRNIYRRITLLILSLLGL